MITNVYDVKSVPVYDKDTKQLLGWRVLYLANTVDSPWPMAYTRFFQERRFRNAYRAMCRFQSKLLAKQNENTK